MKIDNSIKSVVGSPAKDGQARQVKTESGKPAAASTEQVQISTLSSRLQQLQGKLSNSPVVDLARVQEIKQAISEGRFKVNTEKVADGLLQAAQSLISSGPAPAPGAAK